MNRYTMRSIIPLLGLPAPKPNRADYNVPCPCCDRGKQKHMNIHLGKDVFRCPKCGLSGGVFDLYAYISGVDRKDVKKELDRVLGGEDPSPSQANRGQDTAEQEVPEVNDYPATDVETRDKTYRTLFSLLTLASDHRNNLLGRGLDNAAIERLGYRTTPTFGHELIAKKLIEAGCSLPGVPGFHRDDNGNWVLVDGARGIMTPVCDYLGRIQGVKIRRDNVKRRKFRWLSSNNRQDGCKAESWVHLVGPVREEIILTEGPMKADVIHHLTGQTVLAVPGANALAQLEQVLAELRKLGLRRIMTGFDMDYLSKWTVQNGYWELVCLLDRMGFKFGTYLWLPTYNGLDDYIWKYQMNEQMAA